MSTLLQRLSEWAMILAIMGLELVLELELDLVLGEDWEIIGVDITRVHTIAPKDSSSEASLKGED